MKKILITILATFALAGVSHAGSFGVGVSGGIIHVEGSGTETTTAGTVAGGAANTNSKDVDAASIIGSVFAEYEFDNGWAIGYEHVPGSADVADAKNSRTDETAEDAAGSGSSGSTTRTAQAEVDNFNTVYIEAPIGSAYVRLGFAQVDVNTQETASHGTYGNVSVDGVNYGIGLKGSLGGFMTKTSLEHTDFDDFTITSTTSNKISADLDVTQIKFALVKQF